MEIVVERLIAGPATVRALAGVLSETERERADRFVFERDRRRFVVCRARLRELLAERLHCSPASVEIVYGAHGKPGLRPHQEGTDLRFNVSHCDDLAVYGFSSGREIGVDVEAVRALSDAHDIAAGFFSRGEYAAYQAVPDSDKPEAFFNCWTRKEAYIKALGEGLAHPLDRVDVSLAPDEPARILRVAGITGELCGWSLYSFSPEPGLVAAVVVEARADEVTESMPFIKR